MIALVADPRPPVATDHIGPPEDGAHIPRTASNARKSGTYRGADVPAGTAPTSERLTTASAMVRTDGAVAGKEGWAMRATSVLSARAYRTAVGSQPVS